MPAAPSERPAEVEPARRIAREVLLVYTGVTAIAALLYRVPQLEAWFHVVVAGMFLYLPLLLLGRRDLDRYGLVAAPIGRNLRLALVVALVVFPPFLVGYGAFEKLACSVPGLTSLAPVPCRPGAGLFSHLSLRLPPGLLDPSLRRNLVIAELLVVALPEEFFFRGYVQSRLDEAFAPRHRLLGATVGPGMLAASALFALSHVAVQGNPATLAVFFPGLLFGWMRARSGSILPGVIFHALCNLYIETLNRSFFG